MRSLESNATRKVISFSCINYQLNMFDKAGDNTGIDIMT